MNSLLHICIDTLRFAANLDNNQSAFKIIPTKQIINRLFLHLLPQPQIDQAVKSLLDIINGTSSSLAELKTIESNIVRWGELETRLYVLSQVLQELTAIKVAMFSQLAGHTDLILDDVGVLSYIEHLYINGDQGQPDFVFTGVIAPNQPRMQAQLDAKKAFLNKIAIFYLPNVAYPLFDLDIASSSAALRWQSRRENVMQRPVEDDDLRLFSRDIALGKIRTRIFETSFSVTGNKVCLTMPHVSNATLLETIIVDKNDKTLVACLKLVSTT